jgi:hypothetical protein
MEKSKAVIRFFEWLDENNIIWALGASSVMYYNDHPVEPRDIDLFIRKEDFGEVAKRLSEVGTESVKIDHQSIYNTQGFMTVIVEGIEIDLIAGFYIFHSEGEYRMIFDKSSIDQRIDENGIGINIMSLEDWYILYQLIPGREEKAKTIKEMLKKKDHIRWDLFERALLRELPIRVKESVKEMNK